MSEPLDVTPRGLAVVSSVADEDSASVPSVADVDTVSVQLEAVPPQLTSNIPGVSSVSEGKPPMIESPSMSPDAKRHREHIGTIRTMLGTTWELYEQCSVLPIERPRC